MWAFKAMEIEIDLQRDTMIDFPLRSLASLGEVVIRGPGLATRY